MSSPCWTLSRACNGAFTGAPKAVRRWLHCSDSRPAALRHNRCYRYSGPGIRPQNMTLHRSPPMTPPVSSPAIKVVKSVREQVSAEEWQTRVDLAACYRLTALYGMTEMIANHISCRVPGIARSFPDQSLRDAVRGNRCVLPDQGRSRRQHAVQRLRLWRQRRRLRHSQRHSYGPARCRLRRAYPHAGRHGGLGDGMRVAAAGADLDAVPARRLSRLRRHRRRCRRARAAGAPTSAITKP